MYRVIGQWTDTGEWVVCDTTPDFTDARRIKEYRGLHKHKNEPDRYVIRPVKIPKSSSRPLSKKKPSMRPGDE